MNLVLSLARTLTVAVAISAARLADATLFTDLTVAAAFVNSADFSDARNSGYSQTLF